MIKKMLILFFRDLKVGTRDFLTIYILVVPIIFAIVFNVIAPGINDTTLNIALVEGENKDLEAYLKDFTKVSLHKDVAAIEERINRRDDVFAYVKVKDSYQVISQGDEMAELIDFAKLILVFYEEGIGLEDSTSTIYDFNRTVPPLKKMLVNIAIMFTSIMGGMMIAINIIEEKSDKTVRAIHLTPISKTGYLLGKSIIGAFLPMYGSITLILLCGFGDIHWGQMALIVAVSTIISILVGFIQGINNESVMDAAGSVKMLFLPLGAAVAVAELVSVKWQWTVYWVPFYWTYRATDGVLSYTGTWGFTLLSSGIVFALSMLVYFLLIPKIRKGLI